MRSIIIVVIALLIGILLTLVTLDVTGTASVFGRSSNERADIDPDDYVLVPLSRQDIPAFSAVKYEDIYDISGTPSFAPILKDELPDPPPILLEDFATRINGRVLKNTKSANRYFSEEDFMPVGTSSGVAGAIPAGKRGITIKADEIIGATSLQEGDRFDLLMTVPGRSHRSGGNTMLGTQGQTSISGALEGTTLVLINNGYVVRPVTTRLESRDVASGIFGNEKRTESFPVKEMSIAIDPDETIAITSALAAGRQLVVAVRSGQIGAEQEDRDIPNPNFNAVISNNDIIAVEPPVAAIEVIVGGNRSNFVYEP